MSTRTQAFVLLLFGGALLRLGSGDLLLRFVRPSARPWVLIAGAVFVVLAVWSLAVDLRRHSGPADDDADNNDADNADAHRGAGPVDAHGHHGATRVAWLVLAPVVALVVIAPSALGAFSADRQRTAVSTQQGGEHYDPLPAGDPATVGLFDFVARAVLGQGRTLRGRTVRFEGFVASGTPGDFMIARLVITCCAADAAPVFARVRAPRSELAVPRNRWVEVVGAYAGIDTSAADVPVLRATSVRQVSPPSNPYG